MAGVANLAARFYLSENIQLTDDEFKQLLKTQPPEDICRELMLDDTNWYFNSMLGSEVRADYETFRATVAEQTGTDAENIHLVGSSKYGFSLSPKVQKAFRSFQASSDLDLVIVSKSLFRAIWDELLFAYHSGYRWVADRHGDEVFRRFALLLPEQNYKTTLLRNRAKQLDGIARMVFLKTGTSRTLKYRIYENLDAVVAYHVAGLDRMRRNLENDDK